MILIERKKKERKKKTIVLGRASPTPSPTHLTPQLEGGTIMDHHVLLTTNLTSVFHQMM